MTHLHSMDAARACDRRKGGSTDIAGRRQLPKKTGEIFGKGAFFSAAPDDEI